MLTIIFTIALTSYRRFERDRLVSLFKDKVEERNKIFDKVIALKGRSLEILTSDYTCLDEMVNFIKTTDKTWVEDKIDQSTLTIYRVNAIWIYKLDASLAYSINNLKDSGLEEIPLPKGAFNKLFVQNRFCHFFLNTSQGVMEIWGATIHPAEDIDRKTPAQGYFFAGRLWDKDYVNSLSEFIETGRITITPILRKETPVENLRPEDGVITFSRILTGWDKSPLMSVNIWSESLSIGNLNRISQQQFLLLFIFSVVVLLFILIFFAHWINIPLRLISKTLKTENSTYLENLQKDKTEFGDIARLIDKFFIQRAELLKEISERKSLEELQERFTAILETTPDLVGITEPNGDILYINKSGRQMLGIKEDEDISGKKIYDFVSDSVKSYIQNEIIPASIHEGVWAGEGVFIDQDKREIPVLMVSLAHKAADGSVQFLSCIAHDITGRKRAEERLTKINECLLGLGPNADENINRLTFFCGELMGATCALYNRLDKGLLFSVGQWNTPSDYNPLDRPDGHICYDVIRRGTDEVFVVHNLPETVYAKTDPNVVLYKLQTYIGKAVRCGGNFVGSLCVVYQNDFVPSDLDKRLMGIIASAIGVEEERRLTHKELEDAYNELKQTQSQLVQSEKMAVVGRLASGVAHEVNNPLTGVLNNLQLIKIRIEEKEVFNFEDFKKIINVIEESALRCKVVIQSLLDFSRSPKSPLQLDSLNELIEKVILLNEHEVRLENIIIQKQLQPDLPRIMGDFQLLQQAIFNIISNARWAIQKKSGEEGGLINIETQYKPENERVYIYISDTGIGIPEENLDRIFEPFFTTKSVGEGTGLGLSIVYNIIKEHRGTIEVDSLVNKGTTFKISLPAVLGEKK